MSTKTLVAFFIAAIGGLSALIGFLQLGNRQDAGRRTAVLVVKKSINRGEKISAAVIELKTIPEEMAHKEMLRSADQAVGRIARMSMVEGEFLMGTKIAEVNKDSSGVALLIPNGLRAKSITATNLADRVAGLVSIGDRVDVLLSRESRFGGPPSDGGAEVLVQNAEVLAIGTDGEPPAKTNGNSNSDNKPMPVTLLVTPSEASLLSIGQSEGILSLSLRNPDDKEILDSSQPTEDLPGTEVTDGNPSGDGSLSTDSLGSQTDGVAPKDSDQSWTFDELQALLRSLAQSGADSSRGVSAIRTIRGSQVGIIPIRGIRK